MIPRQTLDSVVDLPQRLPGTSPDCCWSFAPIIDLAAVIFDGVAKNGYINMYDPSTNEASEVSQIDRTWIVVKRGPLDGFSPSQIRFSCPSNARVRSSIAPLAWLRNNCTAHLTPCHGLFTIKTCYSPNHSHLLPTGGIDMFNFSTQP